MGYPEPILEVHVITPFASATPTATLTIQVLAAPDNGAGAPGTFDLIQQSVPQPLAMLYAGARPLKTDLSMISEMPQPPVTTALTTTLGSTAATVASGAGLLDGALVVGNPNVPPGTTIVTGGGTATLVLSAPATGTAAGLATVFANKDSKYRFLELNYVCSATFTAGSLWAGIVLDNDQPALYPPGYVWPAGT